ncbi:MAG: TIM barrel protein [Propionibacteriaceae bacterium]|jgi:inosose dehydratase|nr:TIM barrel protein [Propionibacteriaceae bacterium]
MRIAGAPISWGVCEVPDWGFQLSPERVLKEMAEVGITATEFGPEGFLPAEPEAKVATLAKYGLKAVGGFVPVVLHDPAHDPLPAVERELDSFTAAGAEVLVLAANSGLDGYDTRPVLDDEGWAAMFRNLDRLAELARSRGITPSLHPHVGTMVETADDVSRVLEGSAIPLCLDTGHLLIGGSDPVQIARSHAGRVAHVHAKDVNLGLAKKVQEGELTYQQAVSQGIYVPLGQGDVDFAAIVGKLNEAGFDGWYVMEQDTILPAEPADEGPLGAVRQSIAYLKSLAS